MKKLLFTVLYFASPLPIILVLYISKPMKYLNHPLITSMAKRFLAVSLVYIAYFSVAFLFYTYHKFIRPGKLYKNHLIVSEIIEEASNMWTLKLVPQKNANLFDYNNKGFGGLYIKNPACTGG